MTEIFSKSWMYYVDFLLLFIMIGLCVYMYVDGAYIKKEYHVVEVCYGNPVNSSFNFIVEGDLVPVINYSKI